MSWIRSIQPEEATGELKVEYDKAIKRAGKVFNILKVQSLNAREPARVHADVPGIHARSLRPFARRTRNAGHGCLRDQPMLLLNRSSRRGSP